METIKKLNLSCKEFASADKEWMRFVVQNRTAGRFTAGSAPKIKQKYDIIIGPTANDNTLTVINLFFAGAYGDPSGDAAIDQLILQVESDKLPWQFFFGSQKAADTLVLKGRRQIK
jgi:hypothetical protein